jgi:AAA+ ATPase superfamily predicted ATPase
MNIIGRKKEIKELTNLFNSNKPEFVAIYGRRRVGKTFLVSTLFLDKIVFSHTGISPDSFDKNDRKLRNQLEAFYGSLLSQGMKPKRKPQTWIDAFTLLIEFLESKKNSQRQVIFIDELPWLDTAGSNFIPAFSWFWNQYASKQNNLMLIVCGSANSWIMDHLINAHDGLYNRLTYSIHLSPFSLKESMDYLLSKNIPVTKYKTTLISMILGGIPYYLNYYEDKITIEENIDNLFFNKDAKLSLEFDNLFSSTFDQDKLAKKMVVALSKDKKGCTRKELLEILKLSDGDRIGKTLKALINSDFIVEYVPYMKSKKNKFYKVIDPFCLFYLKFVNNNVSLDKTLFNDFSNKSWTGVAFENLCYYHLDNIKDSLGIKAINTIQFSWFIEGDENKKGAQIDLLIERKDNIISLCEMKFYNKELKIDKDYHFNIINKIERLKEFNKHKFDIIPTLITTFGLDKNLYFDDFGVVITLDDLFK